jgi:hypothetical protein
VGPGLHHPLVGVGIWLSGLGWMFGAIFFPLAYLTRLCVGLLGGFWACWLLFACGAYLARLFIGLLVGVWVCWLLFTLGWLRWLLFAFWVLIPGLLCRGGLGGFNGSFGRAHHARRYDLVFYGGYGIGRCWWRWEGG